MESINSTYGKLELRKYICILYIYDNIYILKRTLKLLNLLSPSKWRSKYLTQKQMAMRAKMIKDLGKNWIKTLTDALNRQKISKGQIVNK